MSLRMILTLLLVSCGTSKVPHYAPVYSQVDSQWHVVAVCDWIPLVRDSDGVIIGCLRGGSR